MEWWSSSGANKYETMPRIFPPSEMTPSDHGSWALGISSTQSVLATYVKLALLASHKADLRNDGIMEFPDLSVAELAIA